MKIKNRWKWYNNYKPFKDQVRQEDTGYGEVYVKVFCAAICTFNTEPVELNIKLGNKK